MPPTRDGITIEVDGVESTLEHLRILGERDLVKEWPRVVRAALKPILPKVRSAAPMRSGHLAKSTKLSVTQRRSQIVARTSSDREQDYAAPIHWGWARRDIAAQPYILDTFKREATQIQRDLERGLADWAARASARLNRNVRTSTRVLVGGE